MKTLGDPRLLACAFRLLLPFLLTHFVAVVLHTTHNAVLVNSGTCGREGGGCARDCHGGGGGGGVVPCARYDRNACVFFHMRQTEIEMAAVEN